MALIEQPVSIKRYGNRRLYSTASAAYVSHADLAGMVEDEEDFVVTDAKTGEDITRAVLREVIINGRAGHG
jgi:polyhydroxyalkanoate synthesis repressor PhaR